MENVRLTRRNLLRKSTRIIILEIRMHSRLACPLCDSNEKEELLSLPYTEHCLQEFLQDYYKGRANLGILTDNNYTINQCQQCGGMWQRDVLDEAGMNDLYGRWIDPAESESKRNDARRRLQLARYCARLLKLFPNPDKALLLDFGAGWGDWCEMARAFGFQVHAAEMSSERVDEIRRKGIEAFVPPNCPSANYNFIHLQQVLEHVPDPRSLISHLTKKLEDRGYIQIGVPNGRRIASLAGTPRELFKKGPAQPLEHINIFTRKSLISFMQQFDCQPARQQEVLICCTSLRTLVSDLLLSYLRLLPPVIFPAGTNMLFQKRGGS